MKLAFSFISSLLLVSCVNASNTSSKANNYALNCDETELIDFVSIVTTAKSIGLYKLNKCDQVDGSTKVSSSNIQYICNLSLVHGISGLAQNTIKVDTFVIGKDFPPHFIYLPEAHKKIVENNALIFGNSGPYLSKDQRCEYTTTFYPNCEYLVFEGSQSRIRYEPIPSRPHDPLFRATLDLVRKHNLQ